VDDSTQVVTTRLIQIDATNGLMWKRRSSGGHARDVVKHLGQPVAMAMPSNVEGVQQRLGKRP
jgi:hypothetical protein